MLVIAICVGALFLITLPMFLFPPPYPPGCNSNAAKERRAIADMYIEGNAKAVEAYDKCRKQERLINHRNSMKGIDND